MKKLILVAAGAWLLASANTPPPTASSDPGAYPACSARITDRCVQRDGSVRKLDRAAPEPGAESELSSVVAAGPAPYAPAPAAAAPAPRAEPVRVARTSYPRCSATVRDRCVQGRSGPRHAAPAHPREIRLAMRAGERG